MSMTTSSFHNNNTEIMIKQESSPSSEDSGLRTTNSTIFPSLHPLSNYYRAKAPSPSDSASTTGTVKKIKVNNYTEKIVRNSGQVSASQVPTKVIKEFNVKPMKTKTVQKVMKDEPLTVSDPMVQALKAYQEQQVASMQRKQVFLRNMIIQQQISKKICEYSAMLNSIKNQEHLMLDLGSQNMRYNAGPDSLLAQNIIPNMTHLVKICQENQNRFSNMITK